MSDKEAYAGIAQRSSGTSDFNRMSFMATQIVNKIATMIPVAVKAVTMVGSDAFVDVQPMVGQIDGANNAVPHGTIHNMPVWQYQAGASAIVMVPIVGDQGLAIFAQSDISSIKKTKRAGNPGSRRKFDWADGVYLGGVFNATPTQTITLSPDGIAIDTTLPITITAPVTNIMGNATVSGTLNIAGKDFATHVHGGVTTGGGNSGPVV